MRAKRPPFCPKSVCFLFFKSKSTNLFQGLDSYDCNFHFVASSRFPGHFEKAWNTTRFCPFFSMNSNGAQGFNFNPCKKWRVVRKATSWWAKTSDILEKNPETCNLASIFYYGGGKIKRIGAYLIIIIISIIITIFDIVIIIVNRYSGISSTSH